MVYTIEGQDKITSYKIIPYTLGFLQSVSLPNPVVVQFIQPIKKVGLANLVDI